jgi:hypothetical protein
MASLRQVLLGAVVAGLISMSNAGPIARRATPAPAANGAPQLNDTDVLQL